MNVDRTLRNVVHSAFLLRVKRPRRAYLNRINDSYPKRYTWTYSSSTSIQNVHCQANSCKPEGVGLDRPTWLFAIKLTACATVKVLDKAGLPSYNLKIYGVTRNKKGVIYDMSKYNIEKVPTFIVYQDGVELGRIVETPKKSLERDLWKIAKKARTIKDEPVKVKKKK